MVKSVKLLTLENSHTRPCECQNCRYLSLPGLLFLTLSLCPGHVYPIGAAERKHEECSTQAESIAGPWGAHRSCSCSGILFIISFCLLLSFPPSFFSFSFFPLSPLLSPVSSGCLPAPPFLSYSASLFLYQASSPSLNRFL